MIENYELTIVGVKPNKSKITLIPGWNMIGFPSNISEQAEQILPREVTKVGIFNTTFQYNIEYTKDLSLELVPGKGYWVYNSADHIVDFWIEY